ncbi:MAG: thioredoxin family protein [Gammaproteobacteria bacterium]|nr:thioredoxin family protein [Gammaproteobacteria bacterium]MDH3534569.1 thioredoxin family protein [Gammaproteobacteria bacterium]
MAQTPSTMLDIGTQAPDFSLPEPATGKTVTLADYAGKPLLVVFSCNHCPYVLHIIESFTAFANDALKRGLAVVMISANDVAGFPDDDPDRMVAMAQRLGFEFPYLYDESQRFAMAYRAACTPDFFLFDGAHRLVYRGQYDGSRPGNQVPVDGSDLKAAVEALLEGGNISADQIPSVGCNIKWRTGNEPDYF